MVIVIPAHAVVLHHNAIALSGPLYRIAPGEIQPVPGLTAHLGHTFGTLADLLQFCGHGPGIFINEEAVHPIGHTLRRAAAVDQHRRKIAGRRLPNHQTVGIIAGWKQEQIRPAVPRPQRLPLGDSPGKDALAAQGLCVLLHLRRVSAAADEHHAKILTPGLKQLQRVQNDPQSLVPHHAAHKQEYRHALRQIVVRCGGGDRLLADPAPGHIHAVFHHLIVSLIADGPEVFPRAVAHHPHLVAGGDIGGQYIQRALLQQPPPEELGYVHIKLRVVCKHQRRIHHVPDGPGQDRGHHRAMAVEQIYLLLLQLPQGLRGKGIARQIAEQPPGIHAGIAGHREGKAAVVGVRVLRRHHDGPVSQLCQLPGIVDNGIGHAVDQRREGII